MLALALFLVADPTAPVVVFKEKSPYQTVYVVDEDGKRALVFDEPDGDLQSIIDLRDPKAVPMEYLRVATGALAFTKGRSRALMIGLGGGAFPMMLRRHIPKMSVEAVEIDPVVANVAKRFFGVSDDVKITIDDGARFIARSKTQYDVILIDAYSADGIPEHLTTRAFFESVRAHVTKGGVAVANIAYVKEGDERPLVDKIALTFPGCTILRGRERGNIIVVAQQSPPPAQRDIKRAFADLTAELDLPFNLPTAVPTIEACR